MAYTINASDTVYKFIVDKINSGFWKPGDKIWSEQKFTEHLGISRVAVRQAIEKLAANSVLKKIKGSGTYVETIDITTFMNSLIPSVLISKDELMDILTFRKYFEQGNIALFMENCTEDDVKKLEESYELMKNTDDIEVFYKADYAFHNTIAEGTKNIFVGQISNLLTDIMLNHQQKLYSTVGPEIGLKYHKHILDAIKENDSEMAMLYMKRHIEVTIQSVSELGGDINDRLSG